MTQESTNKSSDTKPVVGRSADSCCGECGPKVAAKYMLLNGEESSELCELCFKDTVFDLVTNNWTVTITEQKGWTMKPLTVYILDLSYPVILNKKASER